MTTKTSAATDESQTRQLIDIRTKALRAKDINGLISHYTPDHHIEAVSEGDWKLLEKRR